MGIVVGSNASRRLPHYAKILNNTILTGWRRRDGYSGSIRMSSRYGGVQRWKRPIVANNVIALLRTPHRKCPYVREFVANVVLRGAACSAANAVGDPRLDSRRRPTAGPTLLRDRADARYAPSVDLLRVPRTAPDIGACEYVP